MMTLHAKVSSSTLLCVILLLVTFITTGVHSYYAYTPSDQCITMMPSHLTEEPQRSPAPFTVSTDKKEYLPRDSVKVTIKSSGETTLRDVYIQARRWNSSLNQYEPIGHFKPHDDYDVVCAGSVGNGLRYRGQEDKAGVTFYWDAPTKAEGHIYFRVTIVSNDQTSWLDVRSPVLRDPSAPNLPDELTTIPPPPFVIDASACGQTKACYREPAGCVESQCRLLAMWRRTLDHVHFELSADADGWVALAFSDDKRMGDDDVLECVWNEALVAEGKNGVQVLQSQNRGKTNHLLTEPLGIVNMKGYRRDGRIRCQFSIPKSSNSRSGRFDIDRGSHHLLLAKGDVDQHGNKKRHSLETGKYPLVSPSKVSLRKIQDISGTARYPLAKLHGCLMLLAWMMCGSVGLLITKYYKPMWPNSRMCGEKVWFAIHRGCMSVTFCATIVAFIIIFIHVGGYSTLPELPSKAHPILGIITAILCVINPLMSLCRCHEKSHRRPIFNWFHWLVGAVAMVLSTPTIFIGLNLEKVHAPWWVTWVMVAFMLFHLIIELMLEIHGCINGRKQKVREEEFWLQKKHDHRGELYGRELQPVGHHFKKRIIALYVPVVFVLGILMIISVAVG